MPISRSLSNIRKKIELLTMGGEWALAYPRAAQNNLRNYWLDGVFAAASDTIPINYLTLYLVAVGATSSQVGQFTSLTSLFAALCLLPGALLVERYGRRKEITVWFGGVLARIALFSMALLPFFLKGQSLIWAIIIIAVIRSIGGNLAFPAWMSITGDIVPIEGRGRFFASRTVIMVVLGILITYLVGEFIDLVGSPLGYQYSIIMAFIVGMISTFFFSRINDSQAESKVEAPAGSSLKALFKEMGNSPIFVLFCFAAAVWNFSLNIAGPFFNVYMVKDLGFTAAMVGIASVATSITKLLIQGKVGELSDRLGPGKVQMISMFFIPILPMMWLFAKELWHVVLINMFGGVLWGAFELVSFNFLLQLTPDTQRARYSAVYQIIVTVALAGGAALGASIILWWGYNGVFISSAIGRIIGALLFVKLISDLAKKSAGAEPEPA